MDYLILIQTTILCLIISFALYGIGVTAKEILKDYKNARKAKQRTVCNLEDYRNARKVK